MKSLIQLKISTPFKNEFKGEVSSIEVPSISGIIGILPNHMPIISALSEGVIKIHSTNGKIFEVSVKDGFLRFNKNTCIITIKSAKVQEKIA